MEANKSIEHGAERRRRKAYGVRCKEEEVRSQESEGSGQRASGLR